MYIEQYTLCKKYSVECSSVLSCSLATAAAGNNTARDSILTLGGMRYAAHQTLYNIQYKVYIVYCVIYTVYCTIYTVQAGL